MHKIGMWKTNNSAKCSYNEVNTETSINDNLSKVCIKINTEKEFQGIIGFGGAFNEVGWEAVKALDGTGRNLVMNELFKKENCNLTLCRTPIGASDFALDAYSLDDVKDDFEMKHFSIERDKERLIPFIKEAIKTNPDVRIWSCPWSPPYWMKTNGDMCNGGELIDSPEILKAYAEYLIKYIEEYRKEGINIIGFCVQNETDVVNVYPTSTMTHEVMRKFIRAYLIPELMKVQQKPLKTEIWVGTIRDVKGYVDDIVEDPVIKQFVGKIGYQYSSPEVVKDSYTKYPNMQLIHTESPCHNGNNSWEEAKEIFSDIVWYIQSGCTNYCYWNMILDESGLSSWNWKQNSMITIDRKSKEVIYNPEFYIVRHFSKFVLPGAKRLETEGDYKDNYVAFRNPDGSFICVLSNLCDEDKLIELQLNGEVIKVAVQADSIYTIRIEG